MSQSQRNTSQRSNGSRSATWRTHDGSVGCNSPLKTPVYEHNKPRSFPHNLVELSLPSAEEPKTPPRNSHIVKIMEEMKVSRRVRWWQNMMYPVRRVWFGVATRLGIRKNGLLKLRHDVRACEYEDIQVMWEILNRNESEFSHSSKKSNKNKTKNKTKGQCWKLLKWARCAPYYYMCRA